MEQQRGYFRDGQTRISSRPRRDSCHVIDLF